MRWTSIIIGPLLLACGEDTESTDPPSDPPTAGTADVATLDPNPSAGAADAPTTSEMIGGVDAEATQSGGSGNDAPEVTTPENAGMDVVGADAPGAAAADDESDPSPVDAETAGMEDAEQSPSSDSAAEESPTDSATGMVAADPGPEMDAMGEEPGNDADPETDGESPSRLSFATDIWPLWSTDRDPAFVYRGMGSYTGCADATAPCHGAASPGAQLSMVDAETAYAQMMDTPSVSGICAGTQRVAIGDPDQSCLILFYVGRLGPMDLDWVDEAEIELMREWIRQGALP